MFEKLKTTCNSDGFRRNISTIVFWSSIWGIVEATMGYVLHKANFSFGWCIWFPLAFYFMDKIYKKTRKPQYMLYGSLITSAIKLTNIFIEVRVDKVVNPAASIVLEAVALLVFYKLLEKSHNKAGIIGIAGVNILWRGLYVIYLLLMPKYFLAISPLRGLDPFFKFMLLESIVNTIIITTYITLNEKLKNKLIKDKIKGPIKDFNISPIPALLMFGLAILIQRSIA